VLGKVQQPSERFRANLARSILARNYPQVPIYTLEELVHKATTPRFETPQPTLECPLLLMLLMSTEANLLLQYMRRVSQVHGLKGLDPDNSGLLVASAGVSMLQAYAGYEVRAVGVENPVAFEQAMQKYLHTRRLVGVTVDVLEHTEVPHVR